MKHNLTTKMTAATALECIIGCIHCHPNDRNDVAYEIALIRDAIRSRDELLAALLRARDHLIMSVNKRAPHLTGADAPEALAQVRAAIDKAVSQ